MCLTLYTYCSLTRLGGFFVVSTSGNSHVQSPCLAGEPDAPCLGGSQGAHSTAAPRTRLLPSHQNPHCPRQRVDQLRTPDRDHPDDTSRRVPVEARKTEATVVIEGGPDPIGTAALTPVRQRSTPAAPWRGCARCTHQPTKRRHSYLSTKHAVRHRNVGRRVRPRQ